MSKYDIFECELGGFVLTRHGEHKGEPNNAELEFWQRAVASETELASLKSQLSAERDKVRELREALLQLRSEPHSPWSSTSKSMVEKALSSTVSPAPESEKTPSASGPAESDVSALPKDGEVGK